MKKAAVLSILIAAILLAVAVIGRGAAANESPLGWLGGRSPSGGLNSSGERVRQALARLGYVEGKSILI